MEVLYELTKQTDMSLCLGFFDGVHQGHQVVINNTVNFAREHNTKSALITFKKHPLCQLFGYDIKYISSIEDKLSYIEKLGIDFVYLLDFTQELSQFKAIDYLENILIKNFEPCAITTGFNHSFGLNKEGNSEFLKKYSKEYNYKYFEIPPITYNNIVISSSKIKEFIKNGDIPTARKLLGHNFSFTSVVQHGQQLGRTINFPTINLEYPLSMINLPYGVYLTEVIHKDKKYNGIANWGQRPTVNDVLTPTFEIHIFDFSETIYGEIVSVNVIEFIRDEIKFLSIKELKKQITKDILLAKTKLTKK